MVRVALFLMTVTGPALAAPFDADAIKGKCQADWPDDFQMQSFCLDQQKAGHSEVEARRPQLDEELTRALAQCEAAWPLDWTVTAFCMNQNIAARAKIPVTLTGLPDDVAGQIAAKCEAEWPVDFTVQSYCVDQQVQGWRNVNGQ